MAVLAFSSSPWFCWLVGLVFPGGLFFRFLLVFLFFFPVTAEFNKFSCLSAAWFCHSGMEAAALMRQQYVNQI